MKILCICHANICRSFMAQEFLKKLLPSVEVFSRGLYADASYQIPPKVLAALAAHGIADPRHQSTQFTAADLAEADLVFCMENAHLERLLDRYAQYTDKLWLLTDFAWDEPRDILDPIGLGDRQFAKQAERLYQTCEAAAQKIKQDFLIHPNK